MVTLRSIPRISINKLAEYLTANSFRRKRILEDQKYPKTFIVSRYDEAQDALVEYLTDKNMHERKLVTAIDRIGKSLPKTTFESAKKVNCLEALESFYSYSNQFDHLVDFKRISGLRSSTKYNIKGVEVSIRPEITLEFEKMGIKYLGAMKFSFSKTSPVDKIEGEYIATILRDFLDSSKSGDSQISGKHCYIVDIFSGNTYTPPKSVKRKKDEIEAACEEILARWDTI